MQTDTSMIERNIGRVRRFYSYLRTRLSFRHVSGPRFFELAEDEVIGVILGKDIEYYLPYLIEWHMALGVEKFIYIDNASSDRSVDIAAEYSNILCMRTGAPYKQYQRFIRYYAASLYCRGGWRLVLDADELFDYPGSGQVPIRRLAGQLNQAGATAVVGQMLDMVPEGSLMAVQDLGFREAVAAFRWYDLDALQKLDYHSDDILDLSWFFQKNAISNEAIKVYLGGIRRALFGERCLLTKHPLYRPGPGVVPYHPHVTSGVRCADFSAVLKHYKFTGDFLQRESGRVARGDMYTHNEAELRVDAFRRNRDLMLRCPGSQEYGTVEDLLDLAFLVMPAERRALLGL